MVQIKHPFATFWDDKGNSGFLGLKEHDITEVEHEFGVFLPKQYKQLIHIRNGGSVVRRCFKYFDYYKNELMIGSVDTLPLIDDEDSVVKTLMYLPEFFPKGLVPFADDGGGDLTCFDYRKCKENPPIVFWVCGDPEGEDVHFVASSFEEFLNMLYEPEDI